MVQILFTVFGMGYIYKNAQIIHNHGTLLHTTVHLYITRKRLKMLVLGLHLRSQCFLFCCVLHQHKFTLSLPEGGGEEGI